MKYSTLTNVWCILLILLNGEVWSESTVDEIYSNEATIELILHSQDNIRSTKYIHGIYTSAGAVFKVEGNMEQVGDRHRAKALRFFLGIPPDF